MPSLTDEQLAAHRRAVEAAPASNPLRAVALDLLAELDRRPRGKGGRVRNEPATEDGKLVARALQALGEGATLADLARHCGFTGRSSGSVFSRASKEGGAPLSEEVRKKLQAIAKGG